MLQSTVTVYLDSSDYSRLSDPRYKTDTLDKVRLELLRFAESGNIRFAFSAAHLSEMAPLEAKYTRAATARADLLVEFCGRNAFISFDRLIAQELARLATPELPPVHALSTDATWLPEIAGVMTPVQWVDMARELNQTIKEQGLNRQQRRAVKRHLFKANQPTANMRRWLARQDIPTDLSDILRLYPMRPQDAQVIGRDGLENNLADANAFTQPIQTFPPGAQLVFPLAQAFVVFGEKANAELTPRVFSINATYRYLHRTVTETTTIDLDPYLQSQPTPDPMLDKLDVIAKSVEAMARAGQELCVSLRHQTTDGEYDMSRTLTISDALYARLEAIAHKRGMTSIEQLLEAWQAWEDESLSRHEVVRRIDALRDRLLTTYGELPDSVASVREDRAR